MYIDVHCHLNYEDYGSLDNLISDCEAAGVKRIISVGFDVDSSLLCRDIAEKYKSVYFCAGFHPTELKKYREGDLDKIAALCAHPKCVALGEIGLDYHYPDTDKPLQAEIFERQLKLAHELKMPVQIHSRDCAEDMLNTLKANSDLLINGGLLHCYSHSPEMAEEFAKLGLYFSFGGTSTYRRSKKPRRAIAALPADRLLTETDSPYLSPSSAFGKFPNTPLSIPEITANMAELKGETVEDMCELIANNAFALFPKLIQ
ncbi:MAG: TatD family hydrolase [Candidatus Coproplasma sp.]